MDTADKIKRNVEHGMEQSPCSPMDPPKEYELHSQMKVPYEELAKPLQILFDDHQEFLKILDNFEKSLIEFRDNRWAINESISANFRDFFQFLDSHTVNHNGKEEKALFPILREKLIATGECSPNPMNQLTPCDVMEDEHIKVMQLSCLVFNLLGLAAKLPDAKSRDILYQQAMEQGREIVEIMRLHIYKENNVLMPLANRLLSEEEFKVVLRKMKPFLPAEPSDFSV